MGIGYVPQGREIFPLLTVKENLETGYAGLKPADRNIPAYIFELFPILKSMLGRRGGDLSGGQQQQLAIGRALVTRPKVLVLDEPTEGIQPSIIKDIGRALQFLRDEKQMTILLVEQYLDFCREIADDIYIMDRGEIMHSGPAADLDLPEVRRHLMVSLPSVFADRDGPLPILPHRRGGALLVCRARSSQQLDFTSFMGEADGRPSQPMVGMT